MMTGTVAQYQGFIHEQTNHGVHILTMRDDSRGTADAFLTLARNTLYDTPDYNHQTFAVLVDQSQALPLPLNYTFTRLRSLITQVDQPHIYVALVIDNKMLATVITTFIRSLQWKVDLRVYSPHHRENALRWLSDSLRANH